jgi:hypothetical protein
MITISQYTIFIFVNFFTIGLTNSHQQTSIQVFIINEKSLERLTTNLNNFNDYLIGNNDKISLEIYSAKPLYRNQSLIFDLKLNQKLARGENEILIENYNKNKNKNKNKSSIFNCHFIGRLRSDNDHQTVAFSLCNGINGFFYYKSDLKLIETSQNGSNIHYQIIDTDKKTSQLDISKLKNKSNKRSIEVRERFVETLIVADESMAKYLGVYYLESYILTIMNMVAAIYNNPMLENLINIIPVRIIILQEDEEDDGRNQNKSKQFEIIHDAGHSLDNFCEYQNKINYPQLHRYHHDLAVLITKVDICQRSNSPCDTLGYSKLGGMCDPKRSCNINEFTGLSLAITIAHEIAHK